jgi:hypothetical protein
MSDFLPNIENFVFLMLENRSFDNLMGWLYENDHPAQILSGPGTKDKPFMGLEVGKYSNHFDDDPSPHTVERGTSTLNTPDPDPHEPYLHVTKQLFNIQVPPCGERDHPVNPTPSDVPKMDGFLADYATTRRGPGPAGVIADECGLLGKLAKLVSNQIPGQDALAILQTYAPSQVPVITGQAFETPSIWDRLSENGRSSPSDWMVYYQQKLFWRYVYTQEAFSIPDPDSHVAPIKDFFDAIETDTLPAFSYLEPTWLGAHIGNNGNSYHPPAQLEPGECFVNKLVHALKANPKQWEKTLLMITFDEHGGTYDHIAPPWEAHPPWGDATPTFDCEHDFGFDRFGVRVPTILASPWIDEKTVFRSMTDVPYDHTSMIATVLTWMSVPKDKWQLGERVHHAPTFEGVLTRTSPRR